MKVVVVGGTGTIGKAVVSELKKNHEVIVVGHKNGDVLVDITNLDSIEKMYQTIGNDIDAIIATTGKVSFVPLHSITAQDYDVGLKSKLMGQVNLVLVGIKYLKENGSFTLTSGILNHEPILTGSSAAMVNAALEGFVKAAAIEMPKRMRINLVSPTVLTEAAAVYEKFFPGYEPVPAAKVALAYKKSVEGAHTGQVYRVGF